MRLVDGLRRDWLALFLILDRDEGDVERRPLIFYLSHTHTPLWFYRGQGYVLCFQVSLLYASVDGGQDTYLSSPCGVWGGALFNLFFLTVYRL